MRMRPKALHEIAYSDERGLTDTFNPQVSRMAMETNPTSKEVMKYDRENQSTCDKATL